jgi:tape measure domain-containing protein|nr:MAG TPA: tail length tape measure protein [Caudoviricetes sp.]
MSILSNTIKLNDGVSPVLQNISQNASRSSTAMSSFAQKVGGVSDKATKATGSLMNIKSVFLGALGANIAAAAISKVGDALGSVLSMAEEYATVNARLGLIAGSQNNVIALNREIYESARRSRSAYMDVAETVASLSQSAHDAFPDPREVVSFAETINKAMAIGGTKGQAKKNAMIQLTQGLASGQLQGDEFRSIAENAPIIENIIAKTMGVSRGELKKLASEGKITAEVIKKAMTENAAEIEEQFRKLPHTMSDWVTDIQSVAQYAFAPLFNVINELSNSEEFRQFIDSIENNIQYIAPIIKNVANEISYAFKQMLTFGQKAFSFLQEHSGIVTVALYAIGAAAAYSAIVFGIDTAAKIANTIANYALAASQWSLNAAIAANPVGLIAIAIIAVIGAIHLLVMAYDEVTGSTYTTVGVIAGVFGGLFAFLYNGVAYAWNIFIIFANFLLTVFDNPAKAIKNLFGSLWNNIVEFTVSAINTILDVMRKVPFLKSLLEGVGPAVAANFQMKVDSGPLDDYKMGPMNVLETASAWQDAGDGAVGKFSSIWDSKQPDNNATYDGKVDAVAKAAGDTAKNSKKTAKNTEKMAKAIDLTKDEIDRLHQGIMNDAIKQWSNRTIHMNITNNNNIDSSVNSGEFITDFHNGLLSALERNTGEAL